MNVKSRYFSDMKGFFLLTGHIEGISYLVLLFFAMPMKYYFGSPEAVRVVGTIHGLLFVMFLMMLAYVFIAERVGIVRVIWMFLLSLVPFGTFFLRRFLQPTP